MKLNILVTGCTGMVGRNIVDVISKDTRFNYFAPSRSDMNLLEINSVKNFLSQHHIDIVIHSAGVVGGIQANINNPVRFLTENWQMGQNIIMAARDAGIKKLINMGSSCMYPKNINRPILEEDIFAGKFEETNEGYAIAKCAVSRLCNYINREDNSFNYKTLIPCNLYGLYDSFSPEKSHLIPAIIHKLHLAKINNKQEIDIWGDGTSRREFIYTSDLAKFTISLLNKFELIPDIMNVGLGFDYTIREAYEIAAKAIGYEGSFFYDTSKPSGIRQKLTDISKAKSLGWKIETDLESGIKMAYEYYLEHVGNIAYT